MSRSALAVLLSLAACGGSTEGGDASLDAAARDASSDAARPDSGSSPDSGAPSDSGAPADSGRPDAGALADAGGSDAGRPRDGGVSYSTTFDLTEAPISEGGAWTHLGLDWTLVDTADGTAFGTQTGTGGYDDSYAHLSGFPPDQAASAVIHRDAAMDGSCTHEVEILLHWSDAAHDAHGYECNLAFDGSYAQIVRWNGPLSDFTYLASGTVPAVNDGDTISASIVGDLITLSLNGSEIIHVHDATFTTGNPGMGFWRGGACGKRGDYGFKSYAATSVP